MSRNSCGGYEVAYGHLSLTHHGLRSMGLKDFTSDAAIRLCGTPETGHIKGAEVDWGVHLFGFTAGASWSAKTAKLVSSKRLSISAPEMLITEAVVLLGKHGSITDERNVFLRCDKTSACDVSNIEAAYRTAMWFSLNIFIRMCETFNVDLKLNYIASEENVITDAISRNISVEAQKWVSEKGWTFGKQDIILIVEEWEEFLLSINSVHKKLDYLYRKTEAPLMQKLISRA